MQSNLFDAANDGARIRDMLATGADVEQRNPYRDTPLIWAAEKGHVEAVNALLAGGADVKAKNAAGKTAMHYAAASGNVELIEALTTGGAGVSEEAKTRIESGGVKEDWTKTIDLSQRSGKVR